jgi:hypothetical protein
MARVWIHLIVVKESAKSMHSRVNGCALFFRMEFVRQHV